MLGALPYEREENWLSVSFYRREDEKGSLIFIIKYIVEYF